MDKRDEIVLYTKDTIVATTSRGNQEKWLDSDKNIWYKLDHHGFESLAETVASQILIHHSNAFELGIPVTEYFIKKVVVHGNTRIVCGSENFRAPENSIVTAHTLLKNGLGKNFTEQFNAKKNLIQRITLLVDTVQDITRLSDFGQYLTLLFEIDALILNQDRHLNNIAVMRTSSGYTYCPIFDNGAAFLLDYGMYPYDVETKSWISQTRALPFKTTFSTLLCTCRQLYGAQLRVHFSKQDIRDILNPLLQYYPEPFQAYLAERVEQVLMTQKKKYFKI